MTEKLFDRRIVLRDNLLSIGCSHSVAQIVSVEAGGSQKIVDVDYLKSLGLEEMLLVKSIEYVREFYLDELGLK